MDRCNIGVDKKLPVKVTVIGGASWFSIDFIRHIYRERLPIELALYDVHEAKLQAVGRSLELVSQATGHELRYELCSDLRQALRGASHVASSFAIDHVPARARDMEVCGRYGVRPLEGETASPGGLMNTLRHLPLLLTVCREMEQVCPHALLHVFNNPLTRLCYGVSRESSITAVGHCDGLIDTLRHIAPAIDCPVETIGVVAAGTNHLTFILRLYDRRSGADLYPVLASRLDHVRHPGPFDHRLAAMIYKLLGYFPCPGDNHIADQLPFVSERMKDTMPLLSLDTIYPDPADVTAGKGPLERDVLELPEFLRSHSDALARFTAPVGKERLSQFIMAFEGLSGPLSMDSLNLPNHGLIPGLPDGAIVEVPALVTEGRVHGIGVGALPGPLTEVCGRMAKTHCWAVEAVIARDRALALQSLAYEPTVRDLTVIEELLDDLLDVNAPLIPVDLYEGLRRTATRGRVSVSSVGVDTEEAEPSRYQTGLLSSLLS